MDWLTAELVTQLGSSVGVFALAIYFIRSFINYQKDVINDLITEMKLERKQNLDIMTRELDEFRAAVNKIDSRLHFIERALENK
jgi:hypothetical protein